MAEAGHLERIPTSESASAPPRYWWFKRLGAAVVLFVLLGLAIRWWWGCEAERRLQAKIDEYRAAGQPVVLEDFLTDPIPDEENGAYFLKLAVSKITQPPDVELAFEVLAGDSQACANHLDELAQIVEANQEVLQLMRQARSKQIARWNISLRSPLLTSLPLSHLSGQRQLCKLNSVVALYRHNTGDDAEAVAAVRDMLAQADHLEEGEVFVITHLVRVALDGLAASTVEGMAHELQIVGETSSNPSQTAPAARTEVEALIAELLDEQALREGWVRAMYGERMSHLDIMQCLCQSKSGCFSGLLGWPGGGPLSKKIIAFILSPTWKLDTVHALEHYTSYADAADAPNWPAARAALPPDSTWGNAPNTVARFLSLILMQSLERATLIHFRLCAYRRMAATALAIRLYEWDHGRRPETLTELVPDYLPAVPRDPFDAADAELRYLPDAPSPLLYSAGKNGVDDGGAIGLKPWGDVDWEAQDMPFFLNGDRPRGQSPSYAGSQPSSTQAADNDGEVEDAEGHEQEE
ncbi:MAG: hypothetical protein KAY37_15355 [Phycisphaerae bacterium]|nr:hypothetical protein [Phycisphaerae bacterium]